MKLIILALILVLIMVQSMEIKKNHLESLLDELNKEPQISFADKREIYSMNKFDEKGFPTKHYYYDIYIHMYDKLDGLFSIIYNHYDPIETNHYRLFLLDYEASFDWFRKDVCELLWENFNFERIIIVNKNLNQDMSTNIKGNSDEHFCEKGSVIDDLYKGLLF
jgi:hypothetical protein